jgi:hypothetical protein
MNNYFVALEFPAGGSLGFNVKADSEQDAYRKIVKFLPDEIIELGIIHRIIIPQCRIDYNIKSE